jgi:hypothetical protein
MFASPATAGIAEPTSKAPLVRSRLDAARAARALDKNAAPQRAQPPSQADEGFASPSASAATSSAPASRFSSSLSSAAAPLKAGATRARAGLGAAALRLRAAVVSLGVQTVRTTCMLASLTGTGLSGMLLALLASLASGVTGLWTAFCTACRFLAAVAYELVTDVVPHWVNSGISSIAPSFLRQQTLRNVMDAAQSYAEWSAAASALDELQGNNRWKMGFESEEYDYMLIRDSLEALYQARKSDDRVQMAWLLRSTLSRDIAGISNPKLFERCHIGTKDLIEHYVDEVAYQLNYLSTVEIPGMTHSEKTDMFVQIRQAYGRSALLLSGGGGLGINHLGVIKTLYEHVRYDGGCRVGGV